MSVAMCRALRSDWDLDAAVGRLLALGVGEREVARALASVRCLDRHEPTVASARAELALAQALAALRGR